MLNFALKPEEDSFVDDERFFVTDVLSPSAFSIRRERDRRIFLIVDDGIGHEIAPSVRATVGRRSQGNLARVGLDAPKANLMDRGDNYRAAGGHKPR